jgi:hypothetical protein
MFEVLKFNRVFFFSLSFLVWGCQQDPLIVTPPQKNKSTDTYSSEVPYGWFLHFEVIDRYAPGYGPPASARALAYIGLAGYEAAVHGMSGYQSLGDHYRDLILPLPEKGVQYHWPSAVNAAYNFMFRKFYPHIRLQDQVTISQVFLNFKNKYDMEVGQLVANRSSEFGEMVANAIFEWSKKDVYGHEAYLNPHPSGYLPPIGPGFWIPTPPNYARALFPSWGEVRTFALKSNEIIGKPPIPWSEEPSSLFYNQAKEVESWANLVRNGQDFEGKWIGEWWSDDIPGLTFTTAGRFLAITNQVVLREKITLSESVLLYAQLGMSMNDATIGIWKTKYHYNLERPITYIQRNFDNNWTTNLNHYFTGANGINPPHPSYPSGHAGFGAAAAIILSEFFGNNYTMTDNCHLGRIEFISTPRTFNKFTEMAEENGISRIPLGVHYRMDSDEGLRMGYLAGQRVLELPWKK